MPARKTKTFSWKEVSFPLLLTLAGLGTVVTLYASGLFSLTTASNAGTIQETDKVTVDGVNNTTQYLTSMVLHAPGTDEKVILSYDPELNALRIKGAVNADGLIIGNNEASVGNTVLGGTNNQATQGTNTNSLIVGGENNKLNNASNSAIIGGQNNTLLNTENVAVIGSSQTTFPAGEKRENIFIVGGVGNQVKGSNVFILGEGQNVAGSDMVLMGKKIKAWDQRQIFVWSDKDQDFFPQRSNAFYVNTTKGIGLNTNDPQTKFDAGQAGAVRIGITASQVSTCSPNYAGVMAYVHVGGKSGFCGCNGQTWVPLTADPSIQAVCINMQKSPCAGEQPLNANKGAEIALPVWDPNANNGDGAFMPKNWLYSNTNPKAECAYDCQIGYHPGQNNPEGKHLNGACKACSSIDRRYTAGAHNGWKTAGNGNDNCDFSCLGGSFYKNTTSERACPLCSTRKSVNTTVSRISGKTHYDQAWYSPDNNQVAACSACSNKPENAKYTQKDVNSASNTCPWECADGYNKRGNDCSKATWQEQKTRVCRNSGKWKDAYDQITYQCRDSSGVVNDTRICDIWWTKSADKIIDISDTNCNTPRWTSRNCDAPNCQGKCNRDTVTVECRREYRDTYGTSYNQERKTERRQCSGSCDNGTCGAAAQSTKTKPTSNLCAAGSRLQGSVSTNSDGWRWTCKGEHGSTQCFARKLALQAGACNANVNGVNVNWTDGRWPSNATLCSYGTAVEKDFNADLNVYLNKWRWKCEGDVGASKASCAAHKPNTNAWRCDQDSINSCVRLGELNPKAGRPVSGFQNGKQWICENEGNIRNVYCTKCDAGYQGTVYDQNQPAQCIKINQQREKSCSGSKPTWANYIFGSTNYTQTSSDGGVNWIPSEKSWTYTSSSSPWACEYTCQSGYTYNSSTNSCAQAVETVKVCFYPGGCEMNYADGRIYISRVAENKRFQKCIDHPKWEKLSLVPPTYRDSARNPPQFAKNKFELWRIDAQSRDDLHLNPFPVELEKEIAPTTGVNLCAEYAPWQCVGKQPKHAKLGSLDWNRGLSKDVEIKLVPSKTTRYGKCEYICELWYEYTVWSDGVPYCKPQCKWSIPDNATLINWDDQGLTEATEIKLVTSNSPRKCEYMCKTGFTLQNGACEKSECSSIPYNAEFYPRDDEDLQSNVQSIYSISNTSRKCEWQCKKGYDYVKNNWNEFCLAEYRCLLNAVVLDGDVFWQDYCSALSKETCENTILTHNKASISYCNQNLTADFKDKLNPHECAHGCVKEYCSDRPNDGSIFFWRQIWWWFWEGLYYYAFPTICKWVRPETEHNIDAGNG